METNTILGADALLLSLLHEGTDLIFGYPGGTIMPVYDAIYRHSDKIKHILTRHEQGAIHAAQGYARATGKVGVCFATSGPGATNFITGIADAMADSTPLVCVTAQVGSSLLGTNAFQEADMISMTMPITKWSFQITSAAEISSAISKAFFVAKSGRPGPVVIEITKNAQVESVNFSYSSCEGIRSYKNKPNIDHVAIEQAKNMINKSCRPLMLVGQGVSISGAESEIMTLAEQANIPVASTLMGLSSTSTSHKLYVGMVGMHGNYAPNAMTQHCDLLIAIGMRFSDRVTGDPKTYAPNAEIIHIDIDPVEINKIIKVDIGICGDAKDVVSELVKGVNYKDRKEWMEFAEDKYKYEYDSVIKADVIPSGGDITMAEVVRAVANATDSKAIVVTDVGQHQMISARYSLFANQRSFITSGGLGTMGFGLPASIGAKIGTPEREVVLFVGDGGIQMTIQELGTIMQWNVGVKIVILNNSFLGMVRQWQQLFFEGRYSNTPMENPDFPMIASAYGIKSRRVSERCELKNAIDEMFADNKAFILEVAVEKEDNVFPMVPAGASISSLIFNENNN